MVTGIRANGLIQDIKSIGETETSLYGRAFRKLRFRGFATAKSPAGGAYFFFAEKVAKMRLRPIKIAKERHDCGTREKLANAQTVPRVCRILSHPS